MDIVSFCEIFMMVAFGCSWPFNIAKSWRSRTAKGKSLLFELIVVSGYAVGITGKLISWQRSGVFPFAIWVYAADVTMVMIDVLLYFRNSALDRQRDEEEARRSA